jgi:hypothetical protein
MSDSERRCGIIQDILKLYLGGLKVRTYEGQFSRRP